MTWLFLVGAVVFGVVAYKLINAPVAARTSDVDLLDCLGFFLLVAASSFAASFCQRAFGWPYDLMLAIFVIAPMLPVVYIIIRAYRQQSSQRGCRAPRLV